MASATKSVERKNESKTSDKLPNYRLTKALANLESKRKTDFEDELTKEMKTIQENIVRFIEQYPTINANLANRTVSLGYKIHENALCILADIYNVEYVKDLGFATNSKLSFGPSLYDEITKATERLRTLMARKRARDECIVDDRSPKARTDV